MSNWTRSHWLGVALAIASMGAMDMSAQEIQHQHQLERFEIGQRLADCLVNGCSVFTGTIRSVGAAEKEPGEPDEQRAVITRDVEVVIGDWLYGQSNDAHVHLRHATAPAFTKTGLGPWLAWEHVDLAVGRELLVARWAPGASRPTWGGQPDDVALATTDTTLFAPIRFVIEQHARFEGAGNEIARIPQLLASNSDMLFMGYGLTYLMEREGVRNVDQAASLLSKLLAAGSVPDAARAPIANWLASTFYRMSETARRTVTETLVMAASTREAKTAHPALAALVRVADLKMLDAKPYLTPVRQQSIEAHYRAWQAQTKNVQRHPEFEAQIGIR